MWICKKGKVFWNSCFTWLLTCLFGNGIHSFSIMRTFNCLTPRNFQIWDAISTINPIQDGLFRGYSRMGRGQKGPPFLKSVKDILQCLNLAQLYLTQRRSKKYMNHVEHLLSSADISIFSPEIRKFCYIKKYRYRLYFDTWFLFILTFLESL